MKINKNTLLIGSDPEAFLRNRKTQEIVSAIGLIPGSKHEPCPMDGLPAGFCIQTDNIMVEWCVPAVNNPIDMYANMQKCISYTNSIIPADLEVVIQASAFVNPEYLKTRQAKTFGCEPSFNAWTYNVNQAPSNKTTLRTCGGHIHVGYDNPNDETRIAIIRAFDLFLNIPSLILDKDDDRKSMYGKAGEFRAKNYGVEFRGLSNYWLQSLSHVKTIFNGIDKAVDFVNADQKIPDVDQLLIQETINNNDKASAYKLIAKYELDQVLTPILTID